MFEFPFGTMHQLNLDWFLQEWKNYKEEWAAAEAGIDNALQGEIDRVEDAMTDLYNARDVAVAAKGDAETAALSASGDATTASNKALMSEGFAVGEQNGTPVGAGSPYYHVNAKYYCTEAGTYRYLSEAYARGTMGGTPVDPGDTGYEDNAKYYKEQADADATATAADRVQTGLDAAATAADRIQTGLDKDDADHFKDGANAAALVAEGYSSGTQNGTPVGSGSPYYQNNAAYFYSQSAGTSGDLAQDMIAGSESSTTLTADYPAGSYIIVAGTLYRTTISLQTGDTLSVGTNCVLATIGDDLSEIRNMLVTPGKTVFATGIDPDVLTGLYMPGLAPGWKVDRIRARSTMYRLGIKLADNTLIINGLSDVGTSYSDKIHTFVNPATGDVLGYYVLHYKGTDYDVDDKTPTAEASSLDNNFIISEYLSREENIVLIGDSVFGYETENELAATLRKISSKKVFNCGFGGCTMAKTGTTAYNPLTFAGISESIAAGDFSSQRGAITLNNTYPYRYADLASVDWTKPTTIFVDYINNDLTASVPLGDPWEYTETAVDWDPYKFTEAMTYGLNKILTAYPHIKVVFFTSKWRYIQNAANVLVPPYVYQNTANLKADDYNTALETNAKRLGVSVYDFHKLGGANAFNAGYMMIDGKSHFTIEGYERFATVLNNLDKSFIG